MDNKGPASAARRAVPKYAAALMVAALLAAAFFLPEWLTALHDRQLLDNPAVETREEDHEGFAEAIGLTVAEKLLLMRSGTLTVMDLGREMEVQINSFRNAEKEVVVSWKNEEDSGEAELQAYGEELSQVWEARLTAVQQEIRNLQAMGGLPALWSESDEVACGNMSEALYMDPDTQMNFQVYRMTLLCGQYQMAVSVDAQSGRILSFHLRWGWIGRPPAWGLQGAANFGAAWRNYWGMDSVGGGWYSDYNRSILERLGGGDYDVHGQVSFTYDGQTILIPLDSWAYSDRTCALSWNF